MLWRAIVTGERPVWGIVETPTMLQRFCRWEGVRFQEAGQALCSRVPFRDIDRIMIGYIGTFAGQSSAFRIRSVFLYRPFICGSGCLQRHDDAKAKAKAFAYTFAPVPVRCSRDLRCFAGIIFGEKPSGKFRRMNRLKPRSCGKSS